MYILLSVKMRSQWPDAVDTARGSKLVTAWAGTVSWKRENDMHPQRLLKRLKLVV